MADSGTNPVRPNTFELEADVNVEFNEATSRQQINSGESVKTLFGKLRKFLTDLKAVAFTGAYSDLNGTPDLTQYALKSKYGDTTINVGRKAGTTVGSRSTAEGSNTTASGICSHAESGETTASGDFSHAEGLKTTAAQSYTHTEGYNTSSNAPAAHAEGYSSIAAGQASHAEGQGTQAVGNNSHAGGYGASSFNNSSFSHGIYTVANKDGEIAFGKYNKSNDDTVFSVGDGTSDSARHNAFEITTTGGKLHDKDIATTDIIPDLSAYAKKTDVPNIKVNSAVDADTVGGHTIGCDVPENAVFTDTVVDINTMEYSVDFSTISWKTSYLGKFESYITLNNVNKIISINLGDWDNFNPDDIVQALIVGTNIFGFMSNTAKSNGHMTFHITYI